MAPRASCNHQEIQTVWHPVHQTSCDLARHPTLVLLYDFVTMNDARPSTPTLSYYSPTEPHRWRLDPDTIKPLLVSVAEEMLDPRYKPLLLSVAKEMLGPRYKLLLLSVAEEMLDPRYKPLLPCVAEGTLDPRYKLLLLSLARERLDPLHKPLLLRCRNGEVRPPIHAIIPKCN